MSKEICRKHNWIVYEKDHDWDICTECGTKKTFQFGRQANQYIYPNGDVKIVEQKMISLDNLKARDRDDEEFEYEIGDGGKWAKELEDEVDVSLALKKLTKRQLEVVELILRGKTQQQIAKELGIKQNTVSDRLNRAINTIKTHKTCHN